MTYDKLKEAVEEANKLIGDKEAHSYKPNDIKNQIQDDKNNGELKRGNFLVITISHKVYLSRTDTQSVR